MKQKDAHEQLVFMPFEFSSLIELKDWIAKDSGAEIRAAFGPKATRFEDIRQRVTSALFDDASSSSMMVTIRTPYHRLINIGYILLTQALRNSRKVCFIELLYLAKAFREKDFEHRVLRKAVEFALNDLQSAACYIWIYKTNYLFLSIARTLSFRLVSMETDGLGVGERYCYAIGLPNSEDKVQNALAQRYAIPATKTPDMAIPNYLFFKKNLLNINSKQKVDKGTFKRKEGIFYSPILRAEAMRVLEASKPPTINSSRTRHLKGSFEAVHSKARLKSNKESDNKDRETSSTIKSTSKYRPVPLTQRKVL